MALSIEQEAIFTKSGVESSDGMTSVTRCDIVFPHTSCVGEKDGYNMHKILRYNTIRYGPKMLCRV